MATGNKYLLSIDTDQYWGIHVDFENEKNFIGKNNHGKILMQLRDQIT